MDGVDDINIAGMYKWLPQFGSDDMDRFILQSGRWLFDKVEQIIKSLFNKLVLQVDGLQIPALSQGKHKKAI